MVKMFAVHNVAHAGGFVKHSPADSDLSKKKFLSASCIYGSGDYIYQKS